MNADTKDQIAAEALAQFESAVETDGPPLDAFERSQFLKAVNTAIEKTYNAGYASGFNNGELAANSLAEREAHASEPWTVESDPNEPESGWLAANGKKFGHRIEIRHLKPIADAHNATLQPASEKESQTKEKE